MNFANFCTPNEAPPPHDGKIANDLAEMIRHFEVRMTIYDLRSDEARLANASGIFRVLSGSFGLLSGHFEVRGTSYELRSSKRGEVRMTRRRRLSNREALKTQNEPINWNLSGCTKDKLQRTI